MPPMLAGRAGIRRRLSPLQSTPSSTAATAVATDHGIILGVPPTKNINDHYPIYQNVCPTPRGFPNYCNVSITTTLPAKRPKTMSSPPTYSADYIVRVKAQVMTRDDSSGGWVPMGGGGMSEVGLRKIVISSDGDLLHEYHIHGQKILDRSVVLNCVLKKDVQYIKANPTFHHWKTEEKRFGLTFQSSAEARAFDKGVKRAVEDLVEGYNEAHDVEVGDDEVFMAMELPLGRKGSWSQSASTASTTTSSPSPQSPASLSLHDTFAPPPPAPNHHLHRMHYITRPPPPPRPNTTTTSTELWSNLKQQQQQQHQSTPIISDTSQHTTSTDLEIKDFSYVEFNKSKVGSGGIISSSSSSQSQQPTSQHEYSYPTLECVSSEHPSPVHHHRGGGGGSKHLEPPLPIKSKKKKTKLKKGLGSMGGGGGGGSSGGKKQSRHLLSRRSRCVYCHEMFVHEDNECGQCEDAPDKVLTCIERVSCMCCARSLLYHCMADSNGDYGHPCVCDSDGGGGGGGNCKKWTALSILSLLVPCLWCYWPLMACHRCGVGCSCCGGRHKAAASAAGT